MNKKKRFILLIILLWFCSCAVQHPGPVCIKDGNEYGNVDGAFRSRWWNYYERGLSYIEGECYEEACSDLNHALEHNFFDQRMARTYGFHFIDYFPHRELGILHYLKGDYHRAREELEISLKHEPSAKASYYLDKVRKIIMKKETKVKKPVLNFFLEEIWTKDDPVFISGTAEDEQYISSITINDKPVFIESSQKNIFFKESLSLNDGTHYIRITAKNLLGGEISRTIIIHVDRQGPLISLDPLIKKNGKIQGHLYDESGKISLTLNGAAVPVSDGKSVFFTALISESNKSAKQIKLIAIDKLNNKTHALINLDNLRTSYHSLMLADKELITSDAWKNPLLFFRKKDTKGPKIKLYEWHDKQTIFLEKAYVEGEINDENNIEYLTINNRSLLRQKSKHIFFSCPVDLKVGENIIIIESRDHAGNKTVKKMFITRKIPSIFNVEERLSLAIFPFKSNNADSETGEVFQNFFLEKLINQKRFRIIKRDKPDMLLKQQKLTSDSKKNSSYYDKESLKGKIAAHTSLLGNFIETRIGIEIVVRIIDNETSEILAIKDVYDELKNKSGLMSMSERLAIKIHKEFPLTDGLIIQKKGNTFFTDLGKEKIKSARRLIVYREKPGIHHPLTGKNPGTDTEIIGYARIIKVMEKMSRAKLIHNKFHFGLKDKVIVQ
ncbi:Tetratricopeptide repeat protein [Candidatus Magnetomoraceae bacterium gMMP-15]